MRIPPPVITLLFAACMGGVAYYSQESARVSGLIWFSVLFGCLALFFLLPAIVQFIRSKTTVNPYTPHKSSALVCDGVYRFSRNPMYLGMALCLAAFASYLENPFCFVFVFGFAWYMTRFQIRFEEAALAEKFESDFADYCKRVRRWF